MSADLFLSFNAGIMGTATPMTMHKSKSGKAVKDPSVNCHLQRPLLYALSARIRNSIFMLTCSLGGSAIVAFPLLKSIILILVGYQGFPRHTIVLMIVARTMADVTMTPAMTSACAMVSIPLIFVAPRSLPSLPGPSGRAGVGSEVFSYVRSTWCFLCQDHDRNSPNCFLK
jgi:hypothetical protein